MHAATPWAFPSRGDAGLHYLSQCYPSPAGGSAASVAGSGVTLSRSHAAGGKNRGGGRAAGHAGLDSIAPSSSENPEQAWASHRAHHGLSRSSTNDSCLVNAAPARPSRLRS